MAHRVKADWPRSIALSRLLWPERDVSSVGNASKPGIGANRNRKGGFAPIGKSSLVGGGAWIATWIAPRISSGRCGWLRRFLHRQIQQKLSRLGCHHINLV